MFISGQIGLLPRSLELPSPPSLALETALACQHVRRITEALKNNSGGGWQGHTQLALYWLQNFADLRHVKPAVADLVSCARYAYTAPLALIAVRSTFATLTGRSRTDPLSRGDCAT